MRFSEHENVLYILMRTDLPSMNAGKAIAQGSHASNTFLHKAKKEVFGSKNECLAQRIREWEKTTEQGFGTVLVLGATMNDIMNVRKFNTLNSATGYPFRITDVLFEEVVDPTYPYIVNSEIKDLIGENHHTIEPHELESGDFVCFRREVTCAYLFADKNDPRIQELLGHLDLHP